jgi:hypothetical protein
LLTVELINRKISGAREITIEYLSGKLGGLPLATEHAAQLAVDALSALLDKLKSA